MKININVSENLKKLASGAKDLNAKIFVVGGFIRNSLLGYKTSDIDLAGTLNLKKLTTLCHILGFKSEVINEKLGTVLILAGSEQYEYTMFRSENYELGGKHTPMEVEFVTDITTDAKRRDFTVNALYYDPLTNELHDFYNGMSDLQQKTLKCIEEPEVVFKSDGLRILRFIRFACELNFNLDKASLFTAINQVHLLKDISKERILRELKDIVNSDSKYEIFNLQHEKAIVFFNKFGIYSYLFNSQFKNINLKNNNKLYKAFLNSNHQNRYYLFICLVIYNYLNKKQTTNSNIHFVVNTMLGSGGLKDSKENINKIINLYDFLQNLIFKKPITNEVCVKFKEFANEAVAVFKEVNHKKVNKIEVRVSQLKDKNVPFKIGDLAVTNSDLITSGINEKKINKIKIIMFNECLNENLKNEKETLLSYAKSIENNVN